MKSRSDGHPASNPPPASFDMRYESLCIYQSKIGDIVNGLRGVLVGAEKLVPARNADTATARQLIKAAIELAEYAQIVSNDLDCSVEALEPFFSKATQPEVAA